MGCCAAKNSKGSKNIQQNSQQAQQPPQAQTQPSQPSQSSQKDQSSAPIYQFFESGLIISVPKKGSPTAMPLSVPLAQIPNESAQIIINNSILIIAGGFYNQDETDLSDIVYKVELETAEISQLPSLPYPCRGGQIHQYRKHLYLTGSITNGSDEDDPIQPGPLICCHIEQMEWQILPIDYQAKKVINPTILRSPGSFLCNGDIYFLSGAYVNKKGEKALNHNIYTLNLRQKNYEVCQVKFPINLLTPKCGVIGTSQALIVGGFVFNENQFEPNFDAFLYDFKNHEISSLGKINEEIDSYAPHKLSQTTLIFKGKTKLVKYNLKSKKMTYQSFYTQDGRLIGS